MPHRSTHKHAFGPRELTKLALAFDGAWQQLRVEGVEAKTVEHIELTRTKLAQWIFNYATMGTLDVEDVERLKEHGLLGVRRSTERGCDPASQGNIEHALQIVRARLKAALSC
jgi:hypothetical protein